MTEPKHTPEPFSEDARGNVLLLTDSDKSRLSALERVAEAARALIGTQPPNRWGYDVAYNAMDDDIRNTLRAALSSLAELEGR